MTTLLMLAASVALSTLPYTYAGRLVNWNHQAYNDGSDVTVRALNAAGEVLAKTTTMTESDGSSVNYRLPVPLATSKAAGHALPGERITLQVVAEGVDHTTKVAEGYRTVGNPGEGARLDLVLATDTDNDGVPDEYAEYYAYQMGGRYDANADFDGDGQSNYAEYVAGTSPIDALDRFSVNAVSRAEDDGTQAEYLSFSFVANAGRSYSVSRSPSLQKDGGWMMLKFRTEREGEDRTRFSTGDTPETKTIYVPRDPTKTSEFFRLNVE